MFLSKNTPELSIDIPRQESMIIVPADHSDLPTLFEWMNNEAVYRYLSGRPMSEWISLDELMASDRSSRRRISWKLHEWSIRMGDNTHAGFMSVEISENKPEASWGLSVIGPDDMRGCGLGSIAKRLILKELFEGYGLQKVYTTILEGNEASTRYNQKYGAVRTEPGKFVFTRESWLQAIKTSS